MTTYRIAHDRFNWINIVSATPSDVERLRAEFPFIHPLNLEDLLSTVERPKIDEDDNYLFVLMHFPVWDSVNRISRASEVEFIVGRKFLVTVHDGTLKPLIQLYDRCSASDAERQKFMSRSASDAFYALVDMLVDYIFPILNKVDSNIHAIENNIFTADARSIIRDIAVVRRDIIALRRIIRHLLPLMISLERTEHPVIRDELEEYFGDTLDHLNKARDIIDEDAEVISGLADTYNTLANTRINDVVRVLTVISVIMLPLTLVSGIYGMNIELPLDEHPAAFIFVLALMFAIAALMLAYFRHRHWL